MSADTLGYGGIAIIIVLVSYVAIAILLQIMMCFIDCWPDFCRDEEEPEVASDMLPV
jgi:hypothetical protein